MGDTPPPPPRPFSPSPTKPTPKPTSTTPTKPVPQSTKVAESKQPEKPKFGARAYAINGEARRKRKTLIGALVTSWDEAKVAAVPWGFCVSLNRMNENLELTQEVLTFGRNKECTVTFTSPVISGAHCQLRKEQDSSGKIRVFLKDLSTNGTWHNRRKIGKGEEVKIKTGEEFWLVPSDNTLAKVGYVFYLKDEQKSARESTEALKAPQGQVTFVFTDVQSSTNLWEMDSTAMDRSLAMHDHIFRFLISKFNGFEVKTEGDAFMVSFYRIIDAVRWCLAVQSALNNHEWPKKLTSLHPASQERNSSGKLIFNGLRVRMGIHTGKPFCRINPVTNRMDYFGPIVNCSARVSDSAHGGQVVCSQEVYEAIKLEKEKEIESKSSPSPPSPGKLTSKTIKSSTPDDPSDDTGKKISLDDFRKMKLEASEGGLVEREEQKFTVKDDEVKILEINTKYLETMSLKGISEPVQIYEVSFPSLSDRKFPPLRSKGGEEAKKKKEVETPERGDSKHSIRTSVSPARLRISRPPSPTGSIAPTEFQDGDDMDDEGGDGVTDDEQDADDLERLRVVRRDTVEKISRKNTGEPRKSVLAPEVGSATKFLQVSIPSPREASPSQTGFGQTSPPNRRAPPRPGATPSPHTPKEVEASPAKKTLAGQLSPHKSQSPQKPPPSRPPPPTHSSPSRPPSQPSPQNISRTVSISPDRPGPPSRVAPARPKPPGRPAPRART